MTAASEVPVHQSLNVVNVSEIYRTKEWWKAAVRYQFDDDGEYNETAVYLWHDDDGWTRKNKYVIKTEEAWKTDKTIIDQLFTGEITSAPDESLPVSDYYEVGAGETVFQSDGWWKGIVKIVQKGSYETEEVMVYLWQQTEGDWRRRQKYTIKDKESWQEEIEAIEAVLDRTQTSKAESEDARSGSDETDKQISEFKQLNREIDKHLSDVESK